MKPILILVLAVTLGGCCAYLPNEFNDPYGDDWWGTTAAHEKAKPHN